MKKQKILFFFIFLTLFAISITLVYVDNLKKEKIYLSDSQKSLEEQYSTTYANYKLLSNTIYSNLTHNNEVINILNQVKIAQESKQLDQLRTKLFDTLIDSYTEWRSIGIEQLHFHLKNNNSFLRFHAPQKFGDNLEKYRYSVAYVNSTHLPIEGLEMGKILHGFRFVYPVFNYEGNYLLSLEISLSTKQFRDKLRDSFDSTVKFIINKKMVDDKAWETDVSKLYEKTALSENFYRFKDYDTFQIDLKKKDIKQLQKRIKTNKNFSFAYKNKDGLYQVLSFLAVKDIESNKIIAYFVKHSNAPYLDQLEIDFYVFITLLILLFIGSGIYLYKDALHKEELRRSFQTIAKQKEELSDSLYELEKQNIQIKNSVEENKRKDELIAEQSKLASLGEMLANIAHQWRQPLSAISTSASSICVQRDLGILDEKDLNASLKNIIDKTQFLSTTIDDFRNFLHGEKKKKLFSIIDAVERSLQVIDSSLLNHNIQIIKDIDENLKINNYENEFIQALLNIINNAKEANDKQNPDINHRLIFIESFKKEDTIYIQIRDNAGGIEDEVINKVFEPYFTTKHQYQGTGLGLYMTYNIIANNMGGDIKVTNCEFEYDSIQFKGAQFTITFKNNGENDV